MKRKRDYKTVQIGFKTQKEYDKFHNSAIRACGDYRNADCEYIRHCIKEDRRKRTVVEKNKAKALVSTQQMINDILMYAQDPNFVDQIKKMEKENIKLWDI